MRTCTPKHIPADLDQPEKHKPEGEESTQPRAGPPTQTAKITTKNLQN